MLENQRSCVGTLWAARASLSQRGTPQIRKRIIIIIIIIITIILITVPSIRNIIISIIAISSIIIVVFVIVINCLRNYD